MHNIINERIPNFMVEGGGGKPYEGIDVYLLMIQTDIDYNQELLEKAKTFERLATYTNHVIGCEVIDPRKDTRLRESLSQTKEGKDLYDRILLSAPCVCISNHYIGDPNNTSRVTVISLRSADFSADKILREIERYKLNFEQRKGLKEFLIFVKENVLPNVKIHPTIPGTGIGYDFTPAVKKSVDLIIEWLNKGSREGTKVTSRPV
jgi:hypothetical protein